MTKAGAGAIAVVVLLWKWCIVVVGMSCLETMVALI